MVRRGKGVDPDSALEYSLRRERGQGLRKVRTEVDTHDLGVCVER